MDSCNPSATAQDDDYDTEDEKLALQSEDIQKNKKKCRKRRYTQKYTPIWETQNSWIKKSRLSDAHFACKICNKDYVCGTTEVIRHGKSETHVKIEKSQKKQSTLTEMAVKVQHGGERRKVKEAETRMAAFIAENDLSFSISDALLKLIKAISPESAITRNMKCGKDKCSGLIKNVLGNYSKNELIKALCIKKFSLLVDESTDKGGIKHLALVVRLKNNSVMDEFLTLIPLSDATSNNMYRVIKDYFEQNEIPWQQNMIGFASDGTNSMMGENHSLSTLLKSEIPKLFILKCVCHSFALCASKACQELPDGVESMCREIYSYFQHSYKRYTAYKEFQQFFDLKPHKLLQPAQTRWLSLVAVVNRILEQWQALIAFFRIETMEKSEKASFIFSKLDNVFNYLYLMFLQFILPFFTDMNREMQSEKPKLHSLYSKIKVVYKTILDMYMKSEYLNQVQLDAVQYKHPQYMKPLAEVDLGPNVTSYLEVHSDIPERELQKFRVSCLNFYIHCIKQINDRFSFARKDLELMSALSPKSIVEKKVSSIATLAVLLPSSIKGPVELNNLEKEWKLLPNINFDCDPKIASFEIFWQEVAQVKSGDEKHMFPLLIRLIDCISILPHSSATVERIFSTINRNKTKTRNRLSTESLTGIMHTKRLFNDSTHADNYEVPDDIIDMMNTITIYDHKKTEEG